MLVRRPLRRYGHGDGWWILAVAALFALAGIAGTGAIMLGRAQGLGL